MMNQASKNNRKISKNSKNISKNINIFSKNNKKPVRITGISVRIIITLFIVFFAFKIRNRIKLIIIDNG